VNDLAIIMKNSESLSQTPQNLRVCRNVLRLGITGTFSARSSAVAVPFSPSELLWTALTSGLRGGIRW